MVLSYANGSIFTRVYHIAKTCCLLGLPFERIETLVNIRVYVYEINVSMILGLIHPTDY